MLEILFWVIIFLISLFVLIRSSDYFTNVAEKIGLMLNMPPFIIGVTIVSIGTSLPELASSIFSATNNSTEIIPGIIFGSNIANILLVLGIAAIYSKQLKITWHIARVDLPLLIGSAILLTATMYDGIFTFFEALLCLAGYVIYVNYIIQGQKERRSRLKIEKPRFHFNLILTLVLSIFFIYFGAKYTVLSVIKISEFFNIGRDIIAASAVAIGTSLPELMVTIVAAKKGKASMAIGNVLGSNIFNSLAIPGIAGLFATIIIPISLISFTLPMMVMATLMFYFLTNDREVTSWEGWMLILLYVFYVGKLFNAF